MSSHARFSLCLVSLSLLLLYSPGVQAQSSTGESNSVTGCLQKGIEPGGFFIVGEDGTMWELAGKVDAAHVGHKVTVKGQVLHRSAVEEAKFADYEKQEAKGKPYADFQVASLKMAGDSCK